MSKHLLIRLGDDGDLTLKFQIHDSPIAELWVNRMINRNKWPLDHPDRFYGFNNVQQEQERAVNILQQCIATINSHQYIINREFTYTQDHLNYLHNIFEKYHGLLNQQMSDYWNSAPLAVRQALANLNLAVHGAESALRDARPALICTWFGMPKTHSLSTELQQKYGEPAFKFGTVYLNYCEIGKTVEDLTVDNDTYIGKDAFRPFNHYSADFFIAFYDLDLTIMYPRIQSYIDSQKNFFSKHNIFDVYDVRASPLHFPVASLKYTGTRDELMSQIRSRQYVREIIIQ